jgi:hypothetical protein
MRSVGRPAARLITDAAHTGDLRREIRGRADYGLHVLNAAASRPPKRVGRLVTVTLIGLRHLSGLGA